MKSIGSIISRIVIGLVGLIVFTIGRVMREARVDENVGQILNGKAGDPTHAIGMAMMIVGVIIVGTAVSYRKGS